MNSRFALILLVAGAVILLAFVLWQYLFSIYEVSFKVSSQNLYADSQSSTTIEAVPLNAFGFKAPFRVSPCDFELIEGKELVSIVKSLPVQGVLVLKAKDKAGKVVVKIKTKYSLWPSLIELAIYPPMA